MGTIFSKLKTKFRFKTSNYSPPAVKAATSYFDLKRPSGPGVNRYGYDLIDDIKKWMSGKSNKDYTFLSFVTKYAPRLTLGEIEDIYNNTAGIKYGPPKESEAQKKRAQELGEKGIWALVPGPLYSGPGKKVEF